MAENEVINPFKPQTTEQQVTNLDSLVRSHVHDGRETRGVAISAPSIIVQIDTPTNTGILPKKIGDIYVDTTNHKVYISDGTDAVSNWRILN